MSLPRMALMASAMAAAIAAGVAGATAAPQQGGGAQFGRPLTSNEIYQLYGNRSWIWGNGAGYFNVRKRQFTAWSRDGGAPSYGVGTWFITTPGKLCFRAEWRAADGAAPALTCFSHRVKDGVIYQKREPAGEWYVFRHTPARRSDEFAKLRPGDHVVSRMGRIAAAVGR